MAVDGQAMAVLLAMKGTPWDSQSTNKKNTPPLLPRTPRPGAGRDASDWDSDSDSSSSSSSSIDEDQGGNGVSSSGSTIWVSDASDWDREEEEQEKEEGKQEEEEEMEGRVRMPGDELTDRTTMVGKTMVMTYGFKALFLEFLQTERKINLPTARQYYRLMNKRMTEVVVDAGVTAAEYGVHDKEQGQAFIREYGKAMTECCQKHRKKNQTSNGTAWRHLQDFLQGTSSVKQAPVRLISKDFEDQYRAWLQAARGKTPTTARAYYYRALRVMTLGLARRKGKKNPVDQVRNVADAKAFCVKWAKYINKQLVTMDPMYPVAYRHLEEFLAGFSSSNSQHQTAAAATAVPILPPYGVPSATWPQPGVMGQDEAFADTRGAAGMAEQWRQRDGPHSTYQGSPSVYYDVAKGAAAGSSVVDVQQRAVAQAQAQQAQVAGTPLHPPGSAQCYCCRPSGYGQGADGGGGYVASHPPSDTPARGHVNEGGGYVASRPPSADTPDRGHSTATPFYALSCQVPADQPGQEQHTQTRREFWSGLGER